LEEALQAGAKLILLDNFDLEGMREAVRMTAGRAALEASGGISPGQGARHRRDRVLTGYR
jgi:nicotinate-nucleotide pyrophosphorylase (carboxylating)